MGDAPDGFVVVMEKERDTPLQQPPATAEASTNTEAALVVTAPDGDAPLLKGANGRRLRALRLASAALLALGVSLLFVAWRLRVVASARAAATVEAPRAPPWASEASTAAAEAAGLAVETRKRRAAAVQRANEHLERFLTNRDLRAAEAAAAEALSHAERLAKVLPSSDAAGDDEALASLRSTAAAAATARKGIEDSLHYAYGGRHAALVAEAQALDKAAAFWERRAMPPPRPGGGAAA